MINRILINFYGEDEVKDLCKFTAQLSSKYRAEVSGIYVKDMREYELMPTAVEGIVIEGVSNNIIKECEEAEKLKAEKVEKKFREFFPDSKFIIDDCIGTDIVLQNMRGYDLLVLYKGNGITSEIKSILKSRYKPVILVPENIEDGFKNILFADDNSENSNKSFFSFANIFGENFTYNIINVNLEEKSIGVIDYMEYAGIKRNIVEKNGDEFEEIKSEFEKNDLMIMGNLKYFYMIEKIIGKTGVKLLEHSTIPIFIG
jgi:hypothetical protein